MIRVTLGAGSGRCLRRLAVERHWYIWQVRALYNLIDYRCQLYRKADRRLRVDVEIGRSIDAEAATQANSGIGHTG